MKASTPTRLATCVVLGLLLLLAPATARADLVLGTRCEGPGTPECSDRRDNDDDGTMDFPADPECASRDDNDESTPGLQTQEPLTCHTTIIRVNFPQGFPLPRPEFCPHCYRIELIDFRALLEAPLSQVLKSLSKTWEASTLPTLVDPLPDIADNPGIPNLVLEYVGQDEIIGPAEVGEITLREPFSFPAGLHYVGQAFDTRAGKVMTNTGTLSADAPARPGRDGLFDARLSFSRWDSGGATGSLDGFDGELCPRWWRWPGPGPRRPRFDLRISSYQVDKPRLSRATPLELGLLLPLSSSSRATPYVGAGLGYYLLDGDSAAAQDEFGGYGALGVDIHLGDRWGFNLEGAYREVGGDLDLGGPALKAGLGFSF